MTQWGLDTIFNPAKRHMDEEKRRLQSTREQIGDASGGKRIDLESGRVVIQRANEDEDGVAPDPVDAATAAKDGTATSAAKDSAADRARKRHAARRG